MKRYEFLEQTLHLIRVELSESLPDEATLEEMINKSKELIKNIYKNLPKKEVK